MTKQRSDEQRDERGRLVSVVAEGLRFHRVDLLAATLNAVAAERDSLRGVVQAATELVRSAQGSHLFGGAWDPGIVSVRDLAAALGIEPNGPPPPPTEAELQEMRDMLAEVRSDRALAAAADAPQPERCAAIGHPTVTPVSLIPCILDEGHAGDHWSTSGCAGGEVRWAAKCEHGRTTEHPTPNGQPGVAGEMGSPSYCPGPSPAVLPEGKATE